jgi:hypothetical protein
MAAAISSAQVRATLSGLRKWSLAEQRGQWFAPPVEVVFETRPQTWQENSPQAAAVSGVALIAPPFLCNPN